VNEGIYILGINTSHDASACLIKDGEIVVAIEKERLTRSKHDEGSSNINEMITYCINFAQISMQQINFIVVCDIDNIFNTQVFSANEAKISHHLAHAWAAVGLSGFREAAVMVIDGEGSKVFELSNVEKSVCNYQIDFYAEKESCYCFKNDNDDGNNILYPIKKWTSGRGGDSKFSGTDGIGSPYWFLSQHFYQKEHQESKIMGLASYGKFEDKYSYIYKYLPDGDVEIDKTWIYTLENLPKNDLENSFQEYANLAASIQEMLEKAIIHKALWLQEKTHLKNLCFSGGVALNCVANTKLAESGVFDKVFVPFGAGDSSIAIGCAYYGWYILAKGNNRHCKKITPYLGINYKQADVEKAINSYEKHGLIKIISAEPKCADIANHIKSGKIIAWYQNRSEFGPRALGNRSILANPCNSRIRDIINKKVKYRENYRPFAPCILEEYVDDWFDNVSQKTYYMQFVANVKSEKIKFIQAVTHVDKTARIQVVNKDINPYLYELIYEFYKLTKIPILLNTSFNIQEPIVETPLDAIKTFVTSSMDRLYLKNFEIVSTAKQIKSCNEILQNGKLFLIWHKPIELRKTFPNLYTIQQLSGIEKLFRHGSFYQISAYEEIVISKSVFEFINSINPRSHQIIDFNELNTTNIIPDFFETVIKHRIASLVQVSG
jgi:carbamoyltransferase